MAKPTVVTFALPSEFSSDPLTEVIQAGAKELLRTAVQAEVSAFIAEHAHFLDEEGRQRLVRHGFLPKREMMTGIGTARHRKINSLPIDQENSSNLVVHILFSLNRILRTNLPMGPLAEIIWKLARYRFPAAFA
jgi:hypothetical protein